jgi:aminoglycoside phosphotransferase (APT) family kinase protein
MTAEEILAGLVTFIEGRMTFNRTRSGKYTRENKALWEVLQELHALDATQTDVGTIFDVFEETTDYYTGA